ncbi:hypothetical protein LEMLEM_LOCUS19217 [Lemmus lemmus]
MLVWAGEVTQQLRTLAVFQRTQVQFPAPTWQLTAVCNSVPGDLTPPIDICAGKEGSCRSYQGVWTMHGKTNKASEKRRLPDQRIRKHGLEKKVQRNKELLCDWDSHRSRAMCKSLWGQGDRASRVPWVVLKKGHVFQAGLQLTPTDSHDHHQLTPCSVWKPVLPACTLGKHYHFTSVPGPQTSPHSSPSSSFTGIQLEGSCDARSLILSLLRPVVPSGNCSI